jgi:uncharacterized protein involved in exopolysaccharide biosynthesis
MAFRDLYARYDEDDPDHAPARTSPRPAQAPAQNDNFIAIVWRRKISVLATMAVFILAGGAYILVTPPRYLGSTAMLIDPRLGKSVGSDPVQPGFIVDTGAMDSQIKLFTSQTVLARTAELADLKDDPEFNGSQRSFFQRLLHPQTQLEGGVDLKALEDAITIKRPERTYVVSIDVLARDPQHAAEIANDLTKAYIDDQVKSRVEAAQDDTRFVREQLTKLSAQIKEAEDKAEQFKIQNNVVDTNGLRSNEQQVADLTKALGEARARMSDAQARLDEIKSAQRLGRLDASSVAVRSLTIERLRAEQAQAEEAYARLAMTLGPRHPEVAEAQARQAKVAKLIRDELQRLAIVASSDYISARSNESQIAAQVDALKEQSAKISRTLVPLAQLERNVAVLRASFERFARIRDNLTQQEADSPPGRVIATARPPVSPAQPKKVIVGLLSITAGLFFGLIVALLMEQRDQQRRLAWDERGPARREPPRYASSAASRQPPDSRGVNRRYWDDDEL